MQITYLADIRLPLERANGIQSIETCRALSERGHDVTLIVRPDTHRPTRDPYEYYGIPRSPGLAIERAPVAGPAVARRVGYLSFALGRVLGRSRPDVIFTRDLGVAALLARMPAGVRPPVVYESHGYAPEVAAELPRLVDTARTVGARKLARLSRNEALVWREARGYVTITRALADVLVERFGARENLEVVPDGTRIPADRKWTPPPRSPVVVGYAGHLYRWKGVDVLLEALAALPAVQGLIVGGHEGEPDLPRLRSRAAALGIDSRVAFTGHLPPAAVAAQLGRATLLALPNGPSALSSQYTSPLKLFEYMAAGRAIVASDLPSLREVLEHDRNAVLVRAGDAGALAGALGALAADPDRADRLGRQAFADAADYSWARRAERLERVLQRALAS